MIDELLEPDDRVRLKHETASDPLGQVLTVNEERRTAAVFFPTRGRTLTCRLDDLVHVPTVQLWLEEQERRRMPRDPARS